MSDLEDFADQRRGAQYRENEDISRLNRALRAENKMAAERLTASATEIDMLQRELSLFNADYSKRPDWLSTPKKSTPKQATIIGVLSDVHAGEIVMPGEMNGFNKYDLDICEKRLHNFFRQSIDEAKSWQNHEYTGAMLAFLGDLTSGDIHDELVQTNQMSTYDTVYWLVPRLAEGIEMWRKAFKRVHIGSAPGNHGRDDVKPRYKQRSAHNSDTLIARFVAREFKGVPDVTFEIPESLDSIVKVYNYTFSLEHGDELKAFSGSAEIGALGPLMRGTNRKKVSLAAEGQSLDYALWGHFHQLIPLPSRGFIANGSVKGFDEYARGKKFKPEPPQQALMACTPENGITTNTPILVADRKAEGW